QDGQRAVRYWTETAHDHAGTRQRDPGLDRHLHTARTFHGTIDINGLLDPVGGTAFLAELERLEQLLYERDVAAAKARYGDDFTPDQLGRDHNQRRADAAVEMAQRSRLVSDTAPLPRPVLTILCGYQAFGHVCEIAGGTVIAPHQIIRSSPSSPK